MTAEDMPLLDSDFDESYFSNEIDLLRETHMGHEVVPISDDEEEEEEEDARPDPVNPVCIPDETSRLLDLPAELRVSIYQFLLPHNLTIYFKQHGNDDNGRPRWIVWGSSKSGDNATYEIGGSSSYTSTNRYSHVHASILRVNKFVSNETRAVLYGSNTYKFTINGTEHHPVSLHSPLIFGPLGTAEFRLPLLRNLRSIHIDVLLDCNSHWTVKRQRSRLEYLTQVLKECANDQNRKSLLQELKVELRLAPPVPRLGTRFGAILHPRALPPKAAEKFIFCLESLTSLRGIKYVEMIGLPDWYAKCLQLCIQGKGGEIHEVDWPLIQVKRRRNTWSRQTKQGRITTRKWYQPKLNWKEFAERNDISMPDDIEKFWTADS